MWISVQAISKLELLSGNNTVHKKCPNSDLQFTSDSGFSLENYNNIKVDMKRKFLFSHMKVHEIQE